MIKQGKLLSSCVNIIFTFVFIAARLTTDYMKPPQILHNAHLIIVALSTRAMASRASTSRGRGSHAISRISPRSKSGVST
ncbi:hypothetical protein BKA67DRAFT_120538 [Truncatella angustata]|uniref:Uncharacterized protein n=1 Tax=Truncatella angustata TaxID=152316 RepID=A0A9P8RGM4_9PEZI|nr:uncharacterized protein BKA67DRAFT_120538 [Truncatella angustata]KAH6645633.1 hypothetical protein BKA67DRAFT_120538 [Truncatella angustata]